MLTLVLPELVVSVRDLSPISGSKQIEVKYVRGSRLKVEAMLDAVIALDPEAAEAVSK